MRTPTLGLLSTPNFCLATDTAAKGFEEALRRLLYTIEGIKAAKRDDT